PGAGVPRRRARAAAAAGAPGAPRAGARTAAGRRTRAAARAGARQRAAPRRPATGGGGRARGTHVARARARPRVARLDALGRGRSAARLRAHAAEVAMPRSLTQGSIPVVLFRFSLPILFANILQSLNGSVNSIWVGRFLGEAALTATSNANT